MLYDPCGFVSGYDADVACSGFIAMICYFDEANRQYGDFVMTKPYLHHILIGVDDLERSRRFYRDVLELEEIDRPAFRFPGLWFRIGGADQHLHIIVGYGALQRTGRPNNPEDVHFALRVGSYRETLDWLHSKGFREELPPDDLQSLQLRPDSITGHPQLYILDPDRNMIEFNCSSLD